MRLLAASLLLLCALAASAANRQETIQLRYLRAEELDRILVSSAQAFGKTPITDAAPAARPNGSLLQGGSVAWTVNPARNTLTVTGNEDAVLEVQRVAQLLDVKPRQLFVKFEVWDKTNALLKGPGVDPAADSATTHVARAEYRIELAALVAQGKAHILDSTGLNGTPGQTMRVLWTPQAGGEVHTISTTPRINSNGTLSLTVTSAVNLGSGTLTSAEKAFRHLASGETGVTVLPTGQVLLITATILPEANPQP